MKFFKKIQKYQFCYLEVSRESEIVKQRWCQCRVSMDASIKHSNFQTRDSGMRDNKTLNQKKKENKNKSTNYS